MDFYEVMRSLGPTPFWVVVCLAGWTAGKLLIFGSQDHVCLGLQTRPNYIIIVLICQCTAFGLTPGKSSGIVHD